MWQFLVLLYSIVVVRFTNVLTQTKSSYNSGENVIARVSYTKHLNQLLAFPLNRLGNIVIELLEHSLLSIYCVNSFCKRSLDLSQVSNVIKNFPALNPGPCSRIKTKGMSCSRKLNQLCKPDSYIGQANPERTVRPRPYVEQTASVYR